MAVVHTAVCRHTSLGISEELTLETSQDFIGGLSDSGQALLKGSLAGGYSSSSSHRRSSILVVVENTHCL